MVFFLFFGRLALSLLLVGVRARSPTVSYASEDCLVVTASGCLGTTEGDMLTGDYEVYDGTCPGNTGSAAYYDAAREMFLYMQSGSWIVSSPCGSNAAWTWSNPTTALYPFLDTSDVWECGSVSIECTLYEGQPAPCNTGSYDPTGVAPSGVCSNTCPSHLPYSKPGSTTFSDCLTTNANLFVVSKQLNRIVAMNADTDDYQLIKEGGEVDNPIDNEFINETELLVSMYLKSRVDKFNIEGRFMGTFALVGSPTGILYLAEFNLVVIASATSGKKVYFFDVNDYQGEPLETTDAVGVLYMSAVNADKPRYLSRGENPDEILITTQDDKVVLMCVPTTTCSTASRVMLMNGGQSFEGIATLHAKGTFLVVDRRNQVDGKIYECSLTWVMNTNVNDCDVFAYMPEGTQWDPYNVEVDSARELVYVADYIYNAIHVFSFTGDHIGRPTNSMGALLSPNAMALRPGPLPSLSSVTPTASLTAGIPYQTTLTLRDSANSPLSPTYPLEAELYRYRVTVTGFFPGTEIASTIEGTISLSSSTLTASLTIPYAGNFTVAVTEGLNNPQTLHNGAFQVTVNPAPTDPLLCASTFPTAVTAGSPFALTLSSFDSFSNPTNHLDDNFEAYFDSSTRFPLTRSSGSFTFSSPMTIASSYTLHVLHRDTEVAYSPFHFSVAPAPLSPPDSVHSLKTTATFDPSTGANLTLQVDAYDEFKNLITDNDNLVAVIDGDINNTIPLLPPTYTHNLNFPKDEERQIKIGFLYVKNGWYQHLPGSPVLIQVAPPPPPASTRTMWIFFGVTLFVILFANYFYSLFAKKKIEVNAERQVSVDEKLRKLLDNKIRMQNGMVLIELGDVGSDALNGVLKLLDLLNGADEVVPWLWVLFVIVAAVAVPLGAYQITNRGRVKTSYRAIINGTDEELLEALDENSAVISAESIKIRRTLVALDLSVTKLGLRGLYIEDVPSLVANAVAIVHAMAQHSKATMSTYATLMAFMFSCLMAGRKFGLRGLERDLAQKKGELEALENMDEAAKKDRASMHRQQAEIANLQEDLRKKKHSDDELAVMKAAMDGLEEKRKDELKEVLIKSSEVKISRLLGKGGFGVVNLATYRGQQTAMKQLLTINDESVKRFRFECFLMKSLRHPNIVKLVGVCWEDSLFACCLEFVANGSLEDWLRRTAGGRAYDPSKKKKKGEKTAVMPLAETVFRGYDYNSKYDESRHTEEDKTQLASFMDTSKRFADECSAWEPFLKPDKTPLDLGAKSWGHYDSGNSCGEAFARIEISATPAQVCAAYIDKRRGVSDAFNELEIIDDDYTTALQFMRVPRVVLGMSDRESLVRSVIMKLEGGAFIRFNYPVQDERKPVARGAMRVWSEYCFVAAEKEGSVGTVSEVTIFLRLNPKLGGLAALFQRSIASNGVATAATPLVKLKRDVERLLGEYEPQLEENESGTQSLTWKGQLLNIATQCALGVQYLHHEQYWAEEEVKEDGEVVAVGYRECIIHRDLKPDNMLLTKDWQLKLTDFGEARAVNLNQTMTSVGTPIYVAPEVMKGNSYDATADSYSFGICLVAMIRGEKDVMAFYFQALRKTMKRKSTKGCGVAILNSRMYGKREWRPLLPVEFELSYPKLCKLLKRCWAPLKEDRPGFDEIVKTMQGEVAEEVMRKEEPVITIYKDEPDSIYHERMGKDEQFEDFGEEGMDTTKMVCQRVHTETLEKKDAVIKELQGVHAASLEKKERIHAETLETLEKKKEAVIEKRDAVIKELQARVKSFEDAKDEGEDKM